MNVLGTVSDASFICALVALPFFFVNFLRYSFRRHSTNVRFPLKSVGGFATSIIVGMMVGDFSQQLAHADIMDELQSLPSDCSISIGGRSVADPKRVLVVLRTLRWAPAHHSSPSHAVFIRIVTPTRELVLNLSRDSSDPHEYWVFLPRYHALNEVGRVFTDILDGY